MRKFILHISGILTTFALVLPVTAQQVDNTVNLPDAQPGECYAKVSIPPKFEMTTEEVIIQEASERIETIEAEYRTVERTQVVKEAAEQLDIKDAVMDTVIERVEVRPAEQIWTSTTAGQTIPASPDALEKIAESGVALDSVAPGSCYVEYFIDAKYESQNEQVVVAQAMEKITVVPAVFETVTERVEVKESSTEVVEVPAVYRTETESVLVEPSRNVWQQCGQVASTDNAGGEIMCLVRVPERYETLTKTVLDRPASSKTINIPAAYETIEVERLVEPAKVVREDIPAEYQSVSKRVRVSEPVFFWLAKDAVPEADAKPTGRTVCLEAQAAEFVAVERKVVVEPAAIITTAIPATYQTIEVQELVTPASERRITIPARTRTVTSRVQSEPGKLEWQQVLCEADVTPQVVLSVQQALRREGYNPGPLDGIIGPGTLEALERFQSENSLGRGGITFESLEKLDVGTS